MESKEDAMKYAVLVSLLALGTAALPGAAEAKGCIKGAAVGGVAGHVAGQHGAAGAAAGCAIGHHEAKKKEAENQNAAANQNATANQNSTANNTAPAATNTTPNAQDRQTDQNRSGQPNSGK
jgi:hypothetical protein